MQNNAHPHPHLSICDRRKAVINSSLPRDAKLAGTSKTIFVSTIDSLCYGVHLNRKLEIKKKWQNGSMTLHQTKKESLNFRLWGVGEMGFKRVSTKVFTVGVARWLIFCCGLDALAIGQCGSFHHLQRVLLWFRWGPTTEDHVTWSWSPSPCVPSKMGSSA